MLARAPHRDRQIFSLLVAMALALSVALPGALFGWVAWKEHRHAFRQAEDSANRTVAVLREHALRTFEATEALSNQVDELIAGRDWDSIEQDHMMHYQLVKLAQALGATSSITLVDAAGVIRATSREWRPPKVSLADRDYMVALREGRGTFVGGRIVGRVSNEKFFPFAKRRSAPFGNFDGAILIAISLTHFTAFWQQFTPSVAHVIPMMREDGEMLVRYPEATVPRRLAPTSPYMQAIRSNPSSGLYTAVSNVDHVERLNAYAKVGDYPVYVAFSIETRAITAAWRHELAPYAWFTTMAILGLLAMSLMVLRFTRHELVSSERWRRTASRLQEEMDRRQAAEERLRQAQKMEIVGRITGGVAHDFNNLLQILTNNLTLADRTTREQAPRQYIRSAFDAVARAAALTRQLLAFSRRQPLDPRPVDVVELVHGMSGLLRTTLGRAVKVRIESEAEAWRAMVDANQAEMAILNLAVNARDAMPEGGVLTLRIANLVVPPAGTPAHELQPGDYVAVSVADTGSGMTREVAQRAFEPFFTTKGVGKGSGLGLSQVHGFAAQSGGTAEISSDPGRGTAVTLFLPRASAVVESRKAANEEAAKPPASPATVLLVDDDEPVRNGIAANLAQLGFRVVEANSGAEALEVLSRGDEVDLLVSDYAMPGMAGAELIRRARAGRPGLKALLITAFAELPPEEQKGLDLLHKPFRSEQLAERIRSLLASKNEPGPSEALLTRKAG